MMSSKMQQVLLAAAVLCFVQLVSAQWGPSVVDTNTGKVRKFVQLVDL